MMNIILTLIVVLLVLHFADGSCGNGPTLPNIDGICNNMNNELWGASNVPFRRICEKLDIDCASNDRPEAQDVCDKVFILNSTDQNDGSYSAFLTYFGQFLDHDFTLTNHPERDCLNGNTTADVCNADACNEGDQCRITRTGTTTATSNECFKFTRSLKDTTGEQKNAITAFIDLSNVYGSDLLRHGQLRSFVDGKLNVAKSDFDCDTLPLDEHDSTQFFAGDVRANENPILVAFHTLFVLEHNKIAEELGEIFFTSCPNAAKHKDHIIFEVARRINIAQVHRIILNEYLHELGIRDLGVTSYKQNTDPGIFQEFSTAAYRFGHSGVKNSFTFLENGNLVQESLQNLFFNTDKFKQNCLEGVLQPQWSIKAEKIDLTFTKSIGEKLFIPTSDQTSFQSLCALNVQRGRDHGLGYYSCLLKECHKEIPDLKGDYQGNNKPTFQELVVDGILTQENADLLNGTYGSDIDNVDLFVAGLAEKPLEGGPLGALFHCVLRKQFRHVIEGDRFYYKFCENFDGESHQQHKDCGKIVADIDNRLMSHILCRNMNLSSIPRHVFKNPDNQQHVTCNNNNKLPNLDIWLKSNPQCNI